MKYFYDCEFHEDGKTIDFISIGVYAEDGREYYAVSNEFDTRRVAQNDWLMNNVMPSIAHDKFIVYDFKGAPAVRDIYITDKAALSKQRIGWDIVDFVGGDDNIEFWAWCGAYDHVCLAQLFGKMVDMPRRIPFHTDDLRTLVRLAGIQPSMVPKQPEGLHNALADARWNKNRYDFLMGLLKE